MAQASPWLPALPGSGGAWTLQTGTASQAIPVHSQPSNSCRHSPVGQRQSHHQLDSFSHLEAKGNGEESSHGAPQHPTVPTSGKWLQRGWELGRLLRWRWLMQGEERGSPEFNVGHQELPGMKSLTSLCGRGAGCVGGFDFPGCDKGGRGPVAISANAALQMPPWTTTEVIKPQVCLEGNFSLGVFGRSFSQSSWSTPCLR